MTAIMVAGRSGSAFAAQLGTMKLTEEIDAMRTIGVSPMEALVLPRTLAAIAMMPLLGFYSSVIAIIGGGFLCAVSLDIPPITFIQRLREVVPITDLYVGLVKARSEEHTSELQSLMRISYAVFCLTKKTNKK